MVPWALTLHFGGGGGGGGLCVYVSRTEREKQSSECQLAVSLDQ